MIMEKTVKYANSVIEALKQECIDGIIKDFVIPPLINIKTGENTGFAVILHVASGYDYSEKLLRKWKKRFGADEYSISARRNQLQIKFTIRY